mgnify:CR=1 FL=1
MAVDGEARFRVAFLCVAPTGAGHLSRAGAVRRALARAGAPVELRAFGPPLPPALAQPWWIGTPILPSDVRPPERLARSELGRAVSAWEPDLVIVDVYWMAVQALVRSLQLPAWLLLRRVPPGWLRGTPAVPFADDAWERVITIEPDACPGGYDAIDPVVLVNPDECLTAPEVHAALQVPAGHRLELVTHAGIPGELAQLLSRPTPDGPNLWHREILGVHDGVLPQRQTAGAWRATWPAAQLYPAADRIVCGAGYNTFWETRWLGCTERTTVHPFPRSTDDQAWRLQRCHGHVPTNNGADTLAQLLVARLSRAAR